MNMNHSMYINLDSISMKFIEKKEEECFPVVYYMTKYEKKNLAFIIYLYSKRTKVFAHHETYITRIVPFIH